MGPRSRLWIALLIALFVAGLRYALAPESPNDLLWPLCHAREFLAGNDPYGPRCQILNEDTGMLWPPNPMTTAFLALPFTPLPDPLAAAAMTGVMFGVAAFAILATGTPWRLAVLGSWPAIYSIFYAQLPPLLLAVALLPALMPLGLAKPQQLLPTFLLHFTWRRAAACLAFGLLTLLFDPTWPLRFLAQTEGYDGLLPIFTVAAPAFLLLALRWRDPDARFLLLCGLAPQRVYHDLLLMSAVLRSRQEALLWTGVSWVVMLAAPPATAPVSVLVATYLTAAVLILIRPAVGQTVAPRRAITSSVPRQEGLA